MSDQPYDNMLHLLESHTSFSKQERVRELGHNAFVMTDGSGRAVTIVLKYSSFDEDIMRWFSGIGEYQLENLGARDAGFVCLGLLCSEGKEVCHLLVIPALELQDWGRTGLLGGRQQTSATPQWKMRVYPRGGHLHLNGVDGLVIDQYADAYQLLEST